MRNLFPLLLFISFCSCRQKVDDGSAYEFYTRMTTEFNAAKSAQHEFSDKMSDVLWHLKKNPILEIDTADLKHLLGEAYQMNIQRLRDIGKIPEFDNDMDFRGTALHFIITLDAAYRKQYPAAIAVFGERTVDRYERARDILNPQLMLLVKEAGKLEDAQNAFRARYPLPRKKNYRSTGSDLVYTKLNDFHYSRVNIAKGTTITIIAYSGSRQLQDTNLYYRQFIGLNGATGDTVRILALDRMQSISDGQLIRSGSFVPDGLDIDGRRITMDNELIIFNKGQLQIENRNYKIAFGYIVFDEPGG